MKNRIRITIFILVTIAVAFLVAAYLYFSPIFAVGTGYAAKILCSSAFVSGRSYDSITSEDLNTPGMSEIKTRQDEKNKAAEASVLGFFKSRAIYRPGLGCTLCIDGANEIVSE